ncbi:hypothetical protein F5H01DRAFT_365014 [Linnemannia elongata]|nr:hypothetical protein F5H01DRAFT_365014 [Linnemannia elongata]
MSLFYLRKTTHNKLQVPTSPRNLAAASIQQMQKCECIHGYFQYSHENNGLKVHPIRALDPASTTISVILPAATSSHLKPLLPYPSRQSMQQQSEDDSENDREGEDEDDDDDEYRNDQDEEDDDEEDEDYDMESRDRREQFDVEMREVVARENASDDSEDMMIPSVPPVLVPQSATTYKLLSPVSLSCSPLFSSPAPFSPQ